MNRINIRELVLNFIFMMFLQLPLIYRVVLFNTAFGFFYVGFILLLPTKLSRSYLMLIGFCSGLFVDIFTNTPGIHASACVFIMFIRNFWLSVIDDDWKEFTNLNVATLNRTDFSRYLFPLIFVHHFILFTVENGGFHLFGSLFTRILCSAVFSFIIIFVINLLVKLSGKRA
ncbi:MAG: Rod shape-determining protein MreD [Ekhidna sp.]|nr:Rod shape-determining protein MreD [Ekhidna sp.]